MNWDYNKGNLTPPGRSLPLGAACDMIQILDPARCSSPLLPAAERTQRDIHTDEQTDRQTHTRTWHRNKHRGWTRTLAVTVQYLLMLNTVLYLSTHLVAFKELFHAPIRQVVVKQTTAIHNWPSGAYPVPGLKTNCWYKHTNRLLDESHLW